MALSVADILKLSQAGISQEDIERISAQTDTPAPPKEDNPKKEETPEEDTPSAVDILNGMLK